MNKLFQASLILASLISSGLLFAGIALAAGPSDQTRNHPQNQNLKGLDEKRLKSCQVKEDAIKKRSVHLGQLVITMEEKFDAIAGRVETYYASKVVPSGKTVANYDSLIVDIQTKKGAVQTALTQAQNDAGSFTCGGKDPKGQLQKFRDDMKAVKIALKDYRTSIKNLIVAVRSVTGATKE